MMDERKEYMKFEQYKKANGETVWRAKAYLGIDDVTGKKVRTTITGRTKSECKLKLEQKKQEFRKNGNTLKKKAAISTFEELTDLWWKTYRQTLKPNSEVNFASWLRVHILPAFGSYKVKAIKPALIQEQVNAWASGSLKGNKAGFKRFDILFWITKTIFQYGVTLELIEDNPCRNIIVPKKKAKEKKVIEYLTNEQIKQFYAYLDSLDDTFYNSYCSTLYKLAIATGCRIGELLALEWSDIDFEGAMIAITKTLNAKGFTNSPKSRTSNRTISIDSETLRMMKQYQRKQRKEAMKLGRRETLVFSPFTDKYASFKTEQSRLDKHIKASGLERFTFHKFRHTHASFLVNNTNLGYKEISERLGHANVGITIDTYSHLGEGSKKKVADLFGQAIANL